MKKLALLFAALALVLSACGASDAEVAATVNGTDFTVGDVNALRFDPDATMSKDEFAQFLGFLIQWNIVVEGAEADYGISLTEEEIDAAADEIFETNAQEGVTYEEFLEANQVSDDFVNKVAHLQLVEDQLGDVLIDEAVPLTDEEIEAQREAAYDNLIEVCVSHILVETEDESEDVLARLDGGEDFADLAMELSTDTGSGEQGGELGCTAPTRYVPEFMEATMEAEVGIPYGPVESDFGFHTVLVTERTLPADDELPTDEEIIESNRNAQLPTILSGWIGDLLEAAEVSVNEKFGTWQSSPAGVIPPSDTTDTTAPAPDATTTTVPAEEETTTTAVEE